MTTEANQNSDMVKMVDIHKWFGRVYALRGLILTSNEVKP